MVLVVYMESLKPQPVNWTPSYLAKHKLPYGTYVLRNELETMFPGTDVKDVREPPYEFLLDTTANGTYFFVNDLVNFDKYEFDELLAFVNRGNDVFVSTHGIYVDTLNIESEQLTTTSLDEYPIFKLVNKNLPSIEFEFDRTFPNMVITKLDTSSAVVLGKTAFVNRENERVGEGINFIKQPYGNGNFYFHTFPEAFTNYFILKSPNQQYTASLLSYLDQKKPILWDEYYKSGKTHITSPMHYLLSHRSLKWAYYISLIGVLFFIIFDGKRKQRAIRVVEPLKNQTLGFTRTIANMYYEKSDHKQIAEHKITHLMEYIRNKFHMTTVNIDDAFINQLAARSANTKDDIRKLFEFINRVHTQNTLTKESLMQLENEIAKFKNPI